MRNRLLKQFVYGLFYLLVFTGLIYLVFNFLKPVPSCQDNKQNGRESGIDCDGDCIPCAVKNLSPIKIEDINLIPLNNREATIVIKLTNPNSAYGSTNFKYDIISTNSDNLEEKILSSESFLYPSEIKHLVHPAVNLNPNATNNISLKITSSAWAERADFSSPRLTNRQTSYISNEKLINLSGLVVSNETISFREVSISALFFNASDHLIGASRTSIFDLEPFAERNFNIVHPLINLDYDKTKLIISALRPNVPGILK